MPNKTIEAIILSRKDYGEADRILTAFSRDEGKIKILAKGSRKLKSKLAAHVEPYTFGKYFLAQGKTYYILAGAEAVNQHFDYLGDLELYKDIAYMAEILDMITVEDQANPVLFDNSKIIIEKLFFSSPELRPIILRYFEFTILKLSGYSPNLETCCTCGTRLTEQPEYAGSFEGIKCPDCKREGESILDLNTLKILRLFGGDKIGSVSAISGIAKYDQRLKRVISPTLYDILPKMPKSQNL